MHIFPAETMLTVVAFCDYLLSDENSLGKLDSEIWTWGEQNNELYTVRPADRLLLSSTFLIVDNASTRIISSFTVGRNSVSF